MEPTISPTTCYDDDKSQTSNDGVDLIANISTKFLYIFEDDLNISSLIGNGSIDHHDNIQWRTAIPCEYGSAYCHIECVQGKSVKLTTEKFLLKL